MPVLLERERPSEGQLKAVRAYIMRRREKEKQALAESKAKEEAEIQRKREQEKKKETVEDVRLEINKLETKLESLKNEKHQLFLQLKKVLNEEAEQKRQRERHQIVPPFPSPHPLMAGSVHRMPYAMMSQRPFVVASNLHVAASHSQPVRMETPTGTGIIKQPVNASQSQVYLHANPANQSAGPSQGYGHSKPGFSGSSDLPYGPRETPSYVQPDKHFKIIGNTGQPSVGSTMTPVSTPATPIHVVTTNAPTDHHLPRTQMSLPQGDNHPAIKLHSPAAPTSVSSVSHGYSALGQHQVDPLPHLGRPLLNQPVTQQTSKHQHPHSQHPQITSSSNTYPKHDVSHQKHLPSQQRDHQQNKQSLYAGYSPKPETSQQQMHHQVTKQQPTHPKSDQIPQHKQPSQHLPQSGNIKQEIIQSTRPQQYGVHSYQQQQHLGATIQNQSSQAYPPQPSSHHAKQPPQTYQTSQSTNYPIKTHQEPDSKQSFQMPSTQQQQTYGYPVQQQQQQAQPQQPYSDHQQYLNKTQAPNQQAIAPVSYPPTVQQSYQSYSSNKEQNPVQTQYSHQQHGYQVVATQQQVYSEQYQGYLSQQYQVQPYHGYPAQVDHKGQQQQHQSIMQNYQAIPQSSQSVKSQSRTPQFDQSNQDQQMPPPPPQKPPPKQDQAQSSSVGHSSHYGEHYHQGQQSSKRSSHRYGHPYKREHHSSSSPKTKISDKHSTSQDDHSGSSSQSSRHHYHPSSKSSHSKGTGSSSSHLRQSRYH